MIGVIINKIKIITNKLNTIWLVIRADIIATTRQTKAKYGIDETTVILKIGRNIK